MWAGSCGSGKAVRRVAAVEVASGAWDQLMRRRRWVVVLARDMLCRSLWSGGIPDAVDVGFAQGTNILPHCPEAEVSCRRVQR